MNYNNHKDNPRSFRALTGLTHIQLSHLLPYFEAAHDDYLCEYELNGKRRSNRRSFCIYKNSPLLLKRQRLYSLSRNRKVKNFLIDKKPSTGDYPILECG